MVTTYCHNYNFWYLADFKGSGMSFEESCTCGFFHDVGGWSWIWNDNEKKIEVEASRIFSERRVGQRDATEYWEQYLDCIFRN